MSGAATMMEQAPFAVSERDGVMLIYDTPTRTVFAAAMDGERFTGLLALAIVGTIPMWLDGLHFAPGLYGALAFTVAGAMAAARYAQLRAHEVRWWTALGPAIWRDARLFGGALAAQWLADVIRPSGEAIGFLGWGYLLLVTWLAVKLARRDTLGMAEAMGKEITVLPRAIVATEALQARLERIVTDTGTLSALPVFDAEAEAVAAAWQKKDTHAIEQLLRAGDTLNRQSWQAAIDRFNAAKDDIDLARGRLRHLVKEADAVLAAHGWAVEGNAERSGVLAGDMDVAALPAKDWSQKLDYSRGTGMAISKAIAGQGPWQLSLAVVAFSGIMMAVNHQKLLRQLKALEGQMKTQAEAVRGDIGMIGDLMRLRLWPHFAGMVSLIGTLEERVTRLKTVEADADVTRADLYLLGCALREAKHELDTKAGDV